MKSRLERDFFEQLTRYRLPLCEREHLFAKHLGHMHRLDFAWPRYMVAVECDGFITETVMVRSRRSMQTVITTGHGTPAQLQADAYKRNMAVILGWSVLVFHENAIASKNAIAITQRALVAKGWSPCTAKPLANVNLLNG